MPGRFQVAGGAIIEKDGKVLITRRLPGRWKGGYWEFVTGRIEQGEDLETGLKREVREEVNLEIELVAPLHVVHFFRGIEKTPENEIFLMTYLAKYLSGEVKLCPEEQDDFAWIDLFQADLSGYPGLEELFHEEIQNYREYRQKLKQKDAK